MTMQSAQVCFTQSASSGVPKSMPAPLCVSRPGVPQADGFQDALQRLSRGRGHGQRIVLVGMADPHQIAAVRVRRDGWPSGALVTLPVSSVGFFALSDPGSFRNGITYEVRPVYRAPRAPFMRPVGIAAELGGRPAQRFYPALARHFSVMRRARQPGDALSSIRHFGARGEYDANPTQSRLVAVNGRLRAWLVPGYRSICEVVSIGRAHGAAGSAGCGASSDPGIYDGHQPLASGTVTPGPAGHRLVVFLLLPDGTHDVVLHTVDSAPLRLNPSPNGVVTYARGGSTITWVTQDGSSHRFVATG
jgi:hypothetical protein